MLAKSHHSPMLNSLLLTILSSLLLNHLSRAYVIFPLPAPPNPKHTVSLVVHSNEVSISGDVVSGSSSSSDEIDEHGKENNGSSAVNEETFQYLVKGADNGKLEQLLRLNDMMKYITRKSINFNDIVKLGGLLKQAKRNDDIMHGRKPKTNWDWESALVRILLEAYKHATVTPRPQKTTKWTDKTTKPEKTTNPVTENTNVVTLGPTQPGVVTNKTKEPITDSPVSDKTTLPVSDVTEISTDFTIETTQSEVVTNKTKKPVTDSPGSDKTTLPVSDVTETTTDITVETTKPEVVTNKTTEPGTDSPGSDKTTLPVSDLTENTTVVTLEPTQPDVVPNKTIEPASTVSAETTIPVSDPTEKTTTVTNETTQPVTDSLNSDKTTLPVSDVTDKTTAITSTQPEVKTTEPVTDSTASYRTTSTSSHEDLNFKKICYLFRNYKDNSDVPDEIRIQVIESLIQKYLK